MLNKIIQRGIKKYGGKYPLANKIGISYISLWRWENGVHGISRDNIKKLKTLKLISKKEYIKLLEIF